MRIIILPDKTSEAGDDFFNMLDKGDLERADTIAEKYKIENITHIFSAPHISTLQTVYPLARKLMLKINVEASLYNICSGEIGPESSFMSPLYKYYRYLYDTIDAEYKSKFLINNIRKREREVSFKNRVCTFISNLCESSINGVVVVVASSHTCDCIVDYLNTYLDCYHSGRPDLCKDDGICKTLIIPPKTLRLPHIEACMP